MNITIPWGTTIEIERRNRILVSVCAYAYEILGESLVSDHDYDKMARSINTSVSTGNATLDAFFKSHYTAHSGMWIHNHPELDRVATYYHKHFAGRA